MDLDKKEIVMLKHYESLFCNYAFDEYDIRGFLMFIREHIREENKYPCILEFSDLIAHPRRSRGIVATAIKNAIDNDYATYDGKKVKKYNGISEERWKREWKTLFSELGLEMNKRLMDEITICVCSMANGSTYDDNQGHTGVLYLGFSKNKIALVTTEGGKDSLHVSFFVYSGLSIDVDWHDAYFGSWVSEAVREDTVLKLRDDTGKYFI